MCTETSWRWAVEDPKCATLLLRHTALQGRSTWTCRDNLQDTCRMTSGRMKFLPSKALKAFHGDFHFHNPNHWISKRDPESSAIPKTHLTSPIRSWPIWDKIKPQHEIAEILQILHMFRLGSNLDNLGGGNREKPWKRQRWRQRWHPRWQEITTPGLENGNVFVASPARIEFRILIDDLYDIHWYSILIYHWYYWYYWYYWLIILIIHGEIVPKL